MTGKHKKAKFDPVAEMRRRINRVHKEIHVLKHKVHLLCLLAHGLKLNSLILDQTLQAVALSLLPSEFLAYSGKTVTLLDVERMSRLFTKVFVCKLGTHTGFHALHDDLTMALTTKIGQNARDYALLFLVIVRCLQIEARFCMSLYPVPLDAVQLLKTDTKPGIKSAELKVPPKKKAQKVHSEPDEVDSDFEVEKPKKVTGKKKVNDASSNKKSGKRGKTGEENAEKCEQSISDCIEHWVEIFTPKDSKWIAVDVVHGSVGSITERNIREPLYYILSFDDNNKVKDITKKYASVPRTCTQRDRYYCVPDAPEDRFVEGGLNRLPAPAHKRISHYCVPPATTNRNDQGTPSSLCNIADCDYKSPRPFNMRRHREKVHACLIHPLPGMPAKEPKVCCDKVFVTLHDYSRHRKLKHGDGHLCQQCGRLLPRRSHLQRHMLVHTQTKPYGCGLCGYASRAFSNLERHMGTAKCSRDAERIAAGLAERPRPEGVVVLIPDVPTMIAVRALQELGRDVRIFRPVRSAGE
ncbi:hypothetical protein HPB49_000408 [Dermacentor silvarum]|uniref:Uncharacterized protein n=1 Tax=Dermacentor silvarum TaxID=543639 RepID=A0ACB8CU25_DERSI|nr:hypothetical protein HPB49_000408 [Dermacentor silvarum]